MVTSVEHRLAVERHGSCSVRLSKSELRRILLSVMDTEKIFIASRVVWASHNIDLPFSIWHLSQIHFHSSNGTSSTSKSIHKMLLFGNNTAQRNFMTLFETITTINYENISLIRIDLKSTLSPPTISIPNQINDSHPPSFASALETNSQSAPFCKTILIIEWRIMYANVA